MQSPLPAFAAFADVLRTIHVIIPIMAPVVGMTKSTPSAPIAQTLISLVILALNIASIRKEVIMRNNSDDVVIPGAVFEILQLQAATILLLSKEQFQKTDLEYKLIQKKIRHEKRRAKRKNNRY